MIHDLDSNPLLTLQSARTQSLIPKLLLGLESMDMTDVNNGTSDVAAVEADGAIKVEEGQYLSWIPSLQTVVAPSG
jgi:hypothetical protein